MSSRIHILTLYFSTPVVPIRLMFNGPDRAAVVRLTAMEHDASADYRPSLVRDDFGNELTLTERPWLILLTDVVRDLEGAGELKLSEARANKTLQQRAQSDPALNNTIIPVSGLVNKH